MLQGFAPPMLVLVQSKKRAKELFHELIYDEIYVDVIRSDRMQSQVGNKSTVLFIETTTNEHDGNQNEIVHCCTKYRV